MHYTCSVRLSILTWSVPWDMKNYEMSYNRNLIIKKLNNCSLQLPDNYTWIFHYYLHANCLHSERYTFVFLSFGLISRVLNLLPLSLTWYVFYAFCCAPIIHHWFPSFGLRQLRNKAISRQLPILFLLSPLSFPCSVRFSPYIFAYIRNSWLLLCSGIVYYRSRKHTRLRWKTILTLTLNCLWIKLNCYTDIHFNYSIRSHFENQYPIVVRRVGIFFSPFMYKSDTKFLK
jgi:hypothetical protein